MYIRTQRALAVGVSDTKFNKNRIRSNGEWFVASDELMDFINEYNNIPNIYVFKNELLNDFVMATTKI